MLDCLIVGGGPAGLTAAIYAARFRLSVQVIDEGAGRAALIPCTRNHAGFPDGVSGAELLARMGAQAVKYGAAIVQGSVDRLARESDGFTATTRRGAVRSRAVLLATGVANRRPAIDPDLHRRAVAAGHLRYCPVCDGFEVTDQEVAVIGSGERGTRETLFLRGYTARLTLISNTGRHDLSPDDRGALEAAGVEIVEGPPADFRLADGRLSLALDGVRRGFDAVYPALGSDAHSALAADLGATLTDEGCIKVDPHQRTSVQGLYAAGDVVIGLDQISHAMGEAGVAATTMRNDLAAQRPIVR